MFEAAQMEFYSGAVDSCDPDLQIKIEKLLRQKNAQNIDFIDYINQKKSFRNPR